MLAVHLHVFFAKMSVEVFHPIFNPVVLSVVVAVGFVLFCFIELYQLFTYF